MNKKMVFLFLMICMVILFFGCEKQNTTNPITQSVNDSSSTSEVVEDDEYQIISILNDKKFEKGVYVRGLGNPIYGDPIETFGDPTETTVNFDYGLNTRPDWHLCQWATRYPFHDIQNTSTEIKNGVETFNYRYTLLSDNHHLYENQSKIVEINTEVGEIRLAVKGSECYKGDRTAGQEWPHLLMEQYLVGTPTKNDPTKISDAVSVRVTLSSKINSFVDNTEEFNPSLHSAMALFYLFVANYDPTRKVFTDMLWFGIPIFDNRYTFAPGDSFPDAGSKESATGKWIYNIPGTAIYDMDNNLYNLDGSIKTNEWVSIDVELLTYIQDAFKAAQNAGYMKNSKFENLYINGMYFGFEIPGNYDIDMSFKNLDILMEKKVK